MTFALGEENVLYSNPRHLGVKPPAAVNGTDIGLWRNYGGSKVWPAPQGWSSEDEWPGPPDPVLDSGPYEAKSSQLNDNAVIRLKSQPDDYSGVTLERDIEVRHGTSSVHLRHRMLNTSMRPVRWAIWQVTQVDAAHGLEIFIPAAGFRQTLGNELYRDIDFDASSELVRLRYANQVAKFAVEANQGWFASLDRARGLVFAETFPVVRGADYPDRAPVAFWISGEGTFTIHDDCVDMRGGVNGCDPHVEAEVMGPLTNLAPGETCELHTVWQLAAIDAERIVAVNHCGVVGRTLAISCDRVTGSFGVFCVANASLIAYDRAAQVVASFDLGKVNPLKPVILDETISLPQGAVRCSLMLFDEQKKRLGTLDHVRIR